MNFNISRKQRNRICKIKNWGTVYYLNGKRHREDGPAMELISGDYLWFFNGKLHRLDGPAIKRSTIIEYWIEGKNYPSKEEFELAVYMYKNGLQDYL